MDKSIPRAAAITAGLILTSFPVAAIAAPTAASPDQIVVKPIIDARLRFEAVGQGTVEADSLTLRVRAGGEVRIGKFSLLAEGEGTLSPVDHYNAFPFPIADEQRRPQFASVPDPRNLELNRLQLQYNARAATVTLGRQRINLDDQRWVGSVGWRQNEQTFDAIRTEAALGPIQVDLAYAISQQTIFGEDAGRRTAIGGKLFFAGVGSNRGPVRGKFFAYLINYDESFALPNSSQTFGGFFSGAVPLGKSIKLRLRASYARQSDYARNPFQYSADYWLFEGATGTAGFDLTAGWERLGSDNGRSVQTPLATLHKFNGWADLFLTTPPGGLEDGYVSIRKVLPHLKALPGFNANLTFHQFDSARGDVEYGREWDASIGVTFGKVGLLAKYAQYDARGFGVDTRKIWLQAEWAL